MSIAPIPAICFLEKEGMKGLVFEERIFVVNLKFERSRLWDGNGRRFFKERPGDLFEDRVHLSEKDGQFFLG